MTTADIETLVADLRPVRPMRSRGAYLSAAGMTGAVILVVAMLVGIRSDVLGLHPAEIVVLRSGALLLIGGAALGEVVASARPGIGGRSNGWRWALAAGALFPLASIVLMLGGDRPPAYVFDPLSVRYCLGISTASALAIGAAIVLALRRGAVTNLRRAGWLTGLAAGGFGTFAYNLFCASGSVHYVALWYSAALVISAVAWRLAVPRLLRW